MLTSLAAYMVVAGRPNSPMRQLIPFQTYRKYGCVVCVGHVDRAVKDGHGFSVLDVCDYAETTDPVDVPDVRAKFFQVVVLGNSFRIYHAQPGVHPGQLAREVFN